MRLVVLRVLVLNLVWSSVKMIEIGQEGKTEDGRDGIEMALERKVKEGEEASWLEVGLQVLRLEEIPAVENEDSACYSMIFNMGVII